MNVRVSFWRIKVKESPTITGLESERERLALEEAIA